MGEVAVTVQADDRETAAAWQDRLCAALGLTPGIITAAGGRRWMARAHPPAPEPEPAEPGQQ